MKVPKVKKEKKEKRVKKKKFSIKNAYYLLVQELW